MRNSVVLGQLRKLALRMLSDSRGRMAELGATVAGALEEMDAAKQDKITGQPGQTAGFDQDGTLVAQDAVTMERVKSASGTNDGLNLKFDVRNGGVPEINLGASANYTEVGFSCRESSKEWSPDDLFFDYYGISTGGTSLRVSFDIPKGTMEFTVKANDTIQDIENHLNLLFPNYGYEVRFDDSKGGIYAVDSAGEEVDLTIKVGDQVIENENNRPYIANVHTPDEDYDAANKKYVDESRQTAKTYADKLVGDIASVLDNINGEAV